MFSLFVCSQYIKDNNNNKMTLRTQPSWTQPSWTSWTQPSWTSWTQQVEHNQVEHNQVEHNQVEQVEHNKLNKWGTPSWTQQVEQQVEHTRRQYTKQES